MREKERQSGRGMKKDDVQEFWPFMGLDIRGEKAMFISLGATGEIEGKATCAKRVEEHSFGREQEGKVETGYLSEH